MYIVLISRFGFFLPTSRKMCLLIFSLEGHSKIKWIDRALYILGNIHNLKGQFDNDTFWKWSMSSTFLRIFHTTVIVWGTMTHFHSSDIKSMVLSDDETLYDAMEHHFETNEYSENKSFGNKRTYKVWKQQTRFDYGRIQKTQNP